MKKIVEFLINLAPPPERCRNDKIDREEAIVVGFLTLTVIVDFIFLAYAFIANIFGAYPP